MRHYPSAVTELNRTRPGPIRPGAAAQCRVREMSIGQPGSERVSDRPLNRPAPGRTSQEDLGSVLINSAKPTERLDEWNRSVQVMRVAMARVATEVRSNGLGNMIHDSVS